MNAIFVFVSLLPLLAGSSDVGDSKNHENSTYARTATSNDNFTLINESPLLLSSNNSRVPAVVLFENFVFQAFNLSDTDLQTFDSSSSSSKNTISYTIQFIQENLDNLYRNLNALNRFVTRNKYAETKE